MRTAALSRRGVLASGGPWTPGLLNPSVWLKADAITGVANGSPLSLWEDASNHNRDGTQSGAFRPTFNTNVKNGLPAVTFNTTHSLFLAGVAAALSGDNDYSLFILNHPTNLPNPNHPVLMCSPATAAWKFIVEYDNSPVAGIYWGHQPGSAGDYRRYTNVVVNDTWPILGLTKTAATAGKIWRTGHEQTAFTPNGSGMVATPVLTGDLRLGSYFANNLGHVGHIAEVLFFPNALSDAERQKVEGHLAHKWALLADLPVSHPYKSVAP